MRGNPILGDGRLSRVLSPRDVGRFIETAPGPGLKYKVALSVAYGAAVMVLRERNGTSRPLPILAARLRRRGARRSRHRRACETTVKFSRRDPVCPSDIHVNTVSDACLV